MRRLPDSQKFFEVSLNAFRQSISIVATFKNTDGFSVRMMIRDIQYTACQCLKVFALKPK